MTSSERTAAHVAPDTGDTVSFRFKRAFHNKYNKYQWFSPHPIQMLYFLSSQLREIINPMTYSSRLKSPQDSEVPGAMHRVPRIRPVGWFGFWYWKRWSPPRLPRQQRPSAAACDLSLSCHDFGAWKKLEKYTKTKTVHCYTDKP